MIFATLRNAGLCIACALPLAALLAGGPNAYRPTTAPPAANTHPSPNSAASQHRVPWLPEIRKLRENRLALKSFQKGREIFRHNTFGNEAFWGETLGLHEAIAGESLGGVGPGVDPATAIAVGLKVDRAALPRPLERALIKGEVDLEDPSNTLALLEAEAVVGVKGPFADSGQLESVGITCALCHSTVDDSLAPGIGFRLDGWANRDLNVGAIIGLSPDLSALANLLSVDEGTVKAVLNSWGPGKFDAGLLIDGKAFPPTKSKTSSGS